jgi:two-component system response regulator ChvI
VEVLAHRLRVIIESQRAPPVATRPETQLYHDVDTGAETERHGDLGLHPATARALWRQHDVGLTIMEYKIVVRLVAHIGETQAYRAIYNTAHYEGFVAGNGEHGYNTNVRSLIKRIRRKFLAVDPSFAEIKNEHCVGYRWRESKR